MSLEYYKIDCGEHLSGQAHGLASCSSRQGHRNLSGLGHIFSSGCFAKFLSKRMYECLQGEIRFFSTVKEQGPRYVLKVPGPLWHAGDASFLCSGELVPQKKGLALPSGHGHRQAHTWNVWHRLAGSGFQRHFMSKALITTVQQILSTTERKMPKAAKQQTPIQDPHLNLSKEEFSISMPQLVCKTCFTEKKKKKTLLLM